MKNAFFFCFNSKALFVLKISKFLSWLFGHASERLDSKDKFNFKCYEVAVWLINNGNNILPNISRSKGNQTMKFRQLTECNMKNVFLEISCTKCGGETSSRPFPEKLKIEHISGSTNYIFMQFTFIVWHVKGYRNMSKLNCKPLRFTLC